MNADYLELTELLKDQQDLSNFFKTSHDWEAIRHEAQTETNFQVLQAFAEHLPLETWFNMKKVWAEVETSNSSDKERFGWMVTVPAVRALLGRKQKGFFVQVGLVSKNYQITFCATLDGDWERTLPKGILFLEAERMCEPVLANGTNLLQPDYLQWVEDNFFPKVTLTEQITFLLALLSLSTIYARQMAHMRVNSMLEFNYQGMSAEKTIEHEVQAIKLHKKVCELLCWEAVGQMEPVAQDKVIEKIDSNLGLSLERCVNTFARRDYEEMVHYFLPFVLAKTNYQNMNEALPEKDSTLSKGLKL